MVTTAMVCGCLVSKNLFTDTVYAVHVCQDHAATPVNKFLLDSLYDKVIKNNQVKKLTEQNNVQC